MKRRVAAVCVAPSASRLVGGDGGDRQTFSTASRALVVFFVQRFRNQLRLTGNTMQCRQIASITADVDILLSMDSPRSDTFLPRFDVFSTAQKNSGAIFSSSHCGVALSQQI